MNVRTVYLDLYRNFRCLAGDCPYDCCSGWRIDIDKKSLLRFESLRNDALRKDIISHIIKDDRGLRFTMTPDRKCSMLDPDGLCRIQRNTSEDMLCITCRKFPRLIYYFNGGILLSMSASCPVVARYLINQNCGFIETYDGKTFSRTDLKEKAVYIEAVNELKDCRCTFRKSVMNFSSVNRKVLFLFAENYFIYRYIDLVFDRKEDAGERCVFETESLLRGFLERERSSGRLTQDMMTEIICRSYRKFAHSGRS